MSDRTTSIVHSIEHAPASRDGHTHNFESAYSQIALLQKQDGGPQSEQFQKDMATVNEKLHADGVLPNLQITGVDETHHQLIGTEVSSGITSGQNPASVNDFGSPTRESSDNTCTFQNPFGLPQNSTDGVVNTLLNSLTGNGVPITLDDFEGGNQNSGD